VLQKSIWNSNWLRCSAKRINVRNKSFKRYSRGLLLFHAASKQLSCWPVTRSRDLLLLLLIPHFFVARPSKRATGSSVTLRFPASSISSPNLALRTRRLQDIASSQFYSQASEQDRRSLRPREARKFPVFVSSFNFS